MTDVWPPGATTGPLVTLTNPDKVLYPATGTTKADVFRYYTGVAEVMLPHIAGRPATRKRWPNGVEGTAFFEKELAKSAPAWLHRGTLGHKSGDTVYPVLDSSVALAWIAQQAALEVHVPQWRFRPDGRPGPANRLVFDLDPGDGVAMAQLCEVAHELRELMDDIGLRVYPLTSGSKGMHLYVPLAEPLRSDAVALLARRVAQQLEQSMPDLVTATMTRSLRAGKVFLDWSQNNAAKTTIAPYSLRGRRTPTVAAPWTWDEVDAATLRQLEFEEVLTRVAERGDLLAGLDDQVVDALTTYRSMRDAGKTPEPVPPVAAGPATVSSASPATGAGNRFVIQEHRARRLHYDFRLERDGVLVSWAVPKNLPDTPSVNHLAVHTEDHPLEYATFEGSIPQGEYGAGSVVVWDSGTYSAEKFRMGADGADGKAGEVIVDLHGGRISGRYALIQTKGDQWLAHRMKEQPSGEDPETAPEAHAAQTDSKLSEFAPMLATLGSVDRMTADQWAFDGKFDGYRMLVEVNHGALRLQTRAGRDVTREYPQLQPLARLFPGHHVILDGEAVALDADGNPNFTEMQNRARSERIQFWAFDILYLDGRSLMRAKYRDRRRLLETFAEGTGLIVLPLLDGDGPQALAESRKRTWEGVVAKQWDSTYLPGRRSSAWIKDKNWNTQEAVIGGWRKGEGGRSSGIGALLLGIPEKDGLRFIGRVGTGFTEKDLHSLKSLLAPLHTDASPFHPALPRPETKDVTYVRPEVVGEVRYGEMTSDGRLRHPSWRGLRPDKEPADVVWEEPA